MTNPQAIYKGGDIEGRTAIRKRLQDECRHLRGSHAVSFCYWGFAFKTLICNECNRPVGC